MSPIDKLFATARSHLDAGRLQQAGALYQQILAQVPDHAPSLHLLGVVALQVGQGEAAVNLIRAAVEADPTMPAYRNDLGEALRLQGDAAGAAECFAAVIALKPDHAGAHVNLGIVRQQQSEFAAALALYERATALRPNMAEAWINRGTLLLQLLRLDEASKVLETALRLAPKDGAARLNLGNLRLEQGRPDEAVALYEKVLVAEPGHAAAMLNLGRALKELGRPADALRWYRQAEAAAPQNPTIQWNLGVCRLLLGDWTRGWQGFEARFAAGAVGLPGIEGPVWTGEPLDGTLLIHAEQGLGDTIQFARFAAVAKARGVGRIVLACQAPLVELMRRVAGVDEVVPRGGPLPPFDAQIALMSLGAALQVTPATMPPAPYLAADPARTAAWTARLGSGFKVGLVWQGHRLHRNDRNRSLPAAALAPLLTVPGVQAFSLQKEPGAGDLAALPGIVDLAPDLVDFAETAATIMALDLVIAVDTAVAHLAGALGKPVWIALPHAPDWRWLMGRSDSPWYGAARLYRQTERGAWAGPIGAMRTVLAKLAA
ncbi:MAG TPA: tetratricopeptide repeat protein [Aliidongia sp.]|uniref:tetratricopeptide repeat protein n=1 Tax=Aliidongia sp. TaxID=1914230 RepID=UPI002DDC9D3F|nr:tetratricopeptide repeat protein [Aliidongia sp.]HEV2674359.1 tetratricopeptide repeat protein [Aliidongia sp.]